MKKNSYQTQKQSKSVEIKELIKESLKSTGLYTDEELNNPIKMERELPSIIGRYDFDLAEFPLFRFQKPTLKKHDKEKPLVYKDTIRGKNGEIVERTWQAYAGRFGFGGASTQTLLYDLLQLYVEQGLDSEYIRFGTIHALFQRRGQSKPSKKDYDRMVRDFRVLEGYSFECENAFWNEKTKSYIDMTWRLFDNIVFFKARHDSNQIQMPFGFVKVNSVLQGIAQGRGFFALGFDNQLYYKLKPLEQRLAVYLAKRFRSHEICVRYVDDLAQALPIEATRPDNVRAILSRTVNGLMKKGLPILQSYKIEKSGTGGEWLAYFYRKEIPKDTLLIKKDSYDPDLEFLVNELIEVSGEPKHRNWWTQCARSLGRDGIFRAIGQFKEKQLLEDLRNEGAMLTAILKDIARQQDVKIK